MKQPLSDGDPLPELTKIIEQRVHNKGSTPWWFLGRLEEVCRAALPELLAARARITELEAGRTQPLAARTRAATLEKIRVWAADQDCILEGCSKCIPCLARTLGANTEAP